MSNVRPLMPKVLCSEFGRSIERHSARAVVSARFGSSAARHRGGSDRGVTAARVWCCPRGCAPDRRARFTRERSQCLQRGSFRRSVPSAGSTSNTSSLRSVRFGPYRAASEFSARSVAAPRVVSSVPSGPPGRALASSSARAGLSVPRYPHAQMLDVPVPRFIPAIRSLGWLRAPLRVAPWPNPSLKRTRSGRPALAFISFWAKPALPTRAA